MDLLFQRLNHTKIALIKVKFAKWIEKKRNEFHKYDSITERNYFYFRCHNTLVKENY